MLQNFYNCDKEKIITLDNVTMAYDVCNKKSQTLEIIKNFNLSVHEGEFLALLGPSGCGKSTILSLMAGSIFPTQGSVKMYNDNISGMDWHRAIMFQSPTLFPWLDVYDNVAFGNKMRKIPKREIDLNVRKCIELVGLSDNIHSKIYELSGGMKQRVALARVLANNPKVILMDEPFSALDTFSKNSMHNLIKNIWNENNNTIVMITHDVDEAIKLASRIIVLSSKPCDIIGMYNPFLLNDKNNMIDTSSIEFSNLKKDILSLIDG